MQVYKHYGFNSMCEMIEAHKNTGSRVVKTFFVSMGHEVGTVPENRAYCTAGRDRLPAEKPTYLVLYHTTLINGSPSSVSTWQLISEDEQSFYADGINNDYQSLMDAWGYIELNTKPC